MGWDKLKEMLQFSVQLEKFSKGLLIVGNKYKCDL